MLVSLLNHLIISLKVVVKWLIFALINNMFIYYFFTYTKLTCFVPLINISTNFTQYI
jgi:hypothetical protein